MRTLAVVAALVLAGTTTAHANLLAFWNMNDVNENNNGTTVVTSYSTSTVPTFAMYGGSLDLDGLPGTAFVDAEGTPHVADVAAAWGSGINDGPPNGFLVTLDTIRDEDLELRFDYRSTSTGSPDFLFEYRVGGVGGFTSLGVQSLIQDSAYHEWYADLSSLDVIEDVAMLEFRFTLSPGSGTGTLRVDNFQITAVPAPGALLLGAMGLALVGRRRFKPRSR